MPGRTLIGIKDTFNTNGMPRLESLRHDLSHIEGISKAHLTMENRVKTRGADLIITDFVVEVDDPFAEAVTKAILKAGFELRGRPLFEQDRVRTAVTELVEAHRNDGGTPLRFAIWFKLEDPADIHLLEISDNVFNPGNGSLQGVSLAAGNSVPEARSIVIYLASPAEFHQALRINRRHAAVAAVLGQHCSIVYPQGGWEQFVQAFPEVAATAA